MPKIEQEIADLLTPYANEMADERLGVFLSLSVGRVMLKNKKIDISVNDIRHITDWLKASIVNNEDWLDNLDDQRRPKKLMKFSSIEGIVKEADKVMLINAQKFSDIKLVEGDEALIAQLENGYYIVKLLTPAALDRESSQMQHCIGQGGYDDYLDDYWMHFLSLRDPAGNAHVTIEIDDGNIQQIQGKQNKKPDKKYMDILIPFLKSQRYFSDLAYNELGYVVRLSDSNTREGEWYKIDDLPAGYVFRTTLYLDHDQDVKSLPKNMTVEGMFSMVNTRIQKLPEGLIVRSGFKASYSDIVEIPEDLIVGADIVLCDTPFLKKIPNNIKYNINLLLNDSGIEELPDGLHVGSSLSLSRSKVKELPNRLKVGGLNISDTDIKELPEDIVINYYLTLTDIDQIDYLPPGVKKYVKIHFEKGAQKEMSVKDFNEYHSINRFGFPRQR